MHGDMFTVFNTYGLLLLLSACMYAMCKYILCFDLLIVNS